MKRTQKSLIHTCEAPPCGTARCEFHHTRGKHEPEQQPADQPEGHTIVLSDPSWPSDYRHWSDKDREEARLQKQVVPGAGRKGEKKESNGLKGKRPFNVRNITHHWK